MNPYVYAQDVYKKLGVDTEAVIKRILDVKFSLQCWQGDDVKGFLFKDEPMTGGIQVTGAYPYKASTADELRQDLEFALSLIPGKHKVNLHAIYLETEEKIDLDQIEPRHFGKWVEWAKKEQLGLDFNPSCFSHPKSASGFTLSHTDENIRKFWIEHAKRSRLVGEYFTKSLGQKAIVNLWIPDGYKDTPYDRVAPRVRLKSSLDEIYKEKLDMIDVLESKLFGIGAEAYTVGSHEFYLTYAIKNDLGICFDAGHFHPTESVADKLAALAPFDQQILLHVSRPMRWDSDHVVIMDDEVEKIAQVIVRENLFEQVSIGFDFFDGSISRVAAWVIGARAFQLALVKAMLEPRALLQKIENDGDYSQRLYYQEALKSQPYGIVYEELLKRVNMPSQLAWYEEIKKYEKSLKR